MRMSIRNLTAGRLGLAAGDIDCFDWSGPGTPATVFSGEAIDASTQREFVLEPSRNSTRNWAMRLTDAASSTEIGTFRLTAPAGTSLLDIDGASREKIAFCDMFAVGRDPWQSPSDLKGLLETGSFSILMWSDGSTIYAATCRPPAAADMMF
jgi:hypothetical protein